MVREYYLNFNGTIGDFIKQHRKAKKVNSVDLAKRLGKANAYVSQIENGHNKKPDFEMLYKIFLQIGIEQDRIEDYLEHFGFISPEREEAELQRAIDMQNISAEEAEEMEKQQEKADEEFYNKMERYSKDPDYLEHQVDKQVNKIKDPRDLEVTGERSEIIQSNLEKINSLLYRAAMDKNNRGFDFVSNLETSFNAMSKDKNLYKFLIHLFDSDLSVLDEASMIKIINVVYGEVNRRKGQTSPWGIDPEDIKSEINKL
ncbi:helix-turn-helix domain-containing protein [Paraliobacillus sp. X-1268]|uniref:helix-turn-helix domain-containing protein n=1 Tax=Paraliobacillus sp. X-1268 TaxID=2213193 RepID=UPI000E3C57E9|nr:helix-turn-helix transcriptional regulator [Paraliobacillus sp. X-1268]